MTPQNAPQDAPQQVTSVDESVTAEALIEEVSIDGMCGVY